MSKYEKPVVERITLQIDEEIAESVIPTTSGDVIEWPEG